MLVLYPNIKPFAQTHIAVDQQHKIYVEQSGNPRGIPVIFCHNGPGGESDPNERRLFDPEHYRIILFDQRGCGQSLPLHCIENNTTIHLIHDMEIIREALEIDKWLVAGGGWGATLALLYAQEYPSRVSYLFLWSIFLARKRDLLWIYHDGANRFFPEHWKKFIGLLVEDETTNIIQAYHQRLHGNDELIRMSAAKAWSIWEASCATLNINNDIVGHYREPSVALNFALLASHYFNDDCFLADNQILHNINKIKHIPGSVVHGRYDMLAPLENAYLLCKRWPAKLCIVREAGHAIVESGIIDALIRASKSIEQFPSTMA